MNKRRVAVGCVVVGVLAGTAFGQDIQREGTGARREALNAMELMPADPAIWRGMGTTLDGKPVTQADADGKVVVLYTWSSFLSSSQAPISALRRLAEAHPDDVLVVGIHHPEAWDEAGEIAKRRRINFPVVHDQDGAIRSALKVDADPDLYVIDRAGQMRFADVDTASLTAAVELLIAESADKAAGTKDRESARIAAEREAARKSRLLTQQMALSDLPDVPFVMPSPEQFQAVRWPRFFRESAGGGNNSGQPALPFAELPPLAVPLPTEGATWFPAPPTGLDGRIRVIHFFTPNRRMTSGDAGAYWDEIESLQRAYRRDMVLIGVAIRQRDSNNRGFNQSQQDEAAIKRARGFLNDFVERRPLNHPILDEVGSTSPLTAAVTADMSNNRGGQNEDVQDRMVAIVGSDGNLRWRGSFTASLEDFRAALPFILKNDPGVKARQEAERAFIRESVGNGTATPKP